MKCEICYLAHMELKIGLVNDGCEIYIYVCKRDAIDGHDNMCAIIRTRTLPVRSC